MKKPNKVITCIGIVFVCICGCGSLGALYFWDQFHDRGSTYPPNVYVISPSVVGLVQIASPSTMPGVFPDRKRLTIQSNLVVLDKPFSDRSGSWIATIGTTTYNDLGLYLAKPTDYGVWSLSGTSVGKYQVIALFVGTNAEALKASKTLNLPENRRELEQKLAQKATDK